MMSDLWPVYSGERFRASWPSCCFIRFVFCCLYLLCLVNQSRNKARVGPPQTSPSPPPSNFIAGRPKAALLFGFFSDFRCRVLFFIVNLVTYKYK